MDDAVVCASLSTVTSLTVTVVPDAPVTRTVTVSVPNPLVFSKKLYSVRVVLCHVLPPSVLTSKLSTASLALTTCMENQYALVPDLLCRTKGDVMPHSTKL